MDTEISYLNSSGEYKMAIVPEELADEAVWYNEELNAYTYTHPITKAECLLHSLADRPCLSENYNRKHWMWKGKLHRTSGPAFTCDGNAEWFAFGISLSETEFERLKHYMLRVEAFAIANGIDLHGFDIYDAPGKYFLSFNSEHDIASCAENNTIPIGDRQTGHVSHYSIDELERETRAEPKGAGLLAAAAIGAVAAFAASKIKEHVSASKHKSVLENHTVNS